MQVHYIPPLLEDFPIINGIGIWLWTCLCCPCYSSHCRNCLGTPCSFHWLCSMDSHLRLYPSNPELSIYVIRALFHLPCVFYTPLPSCKKCSIYFMSIYLAGSYLDKIWQPVQIWPESNMLMKFVLLSVWIWETRKDD